MKSPEDCKDIFDIRDAVNEYGHEIIEQRHKRMREDGAAPDFVAQE